MSDASDRDLGLGRSISRRDFLNGVAIGVGGTLASGLLPDALLRAQAADQARGAARYYPPTLTGMRGSHDGSWEAAHAMRDGRFWSSAGTPTDTRETLRLGRRRRRHQRPVRGALLPAARRAAARILMLDNHDDFGGHAKRNEFHLGGRMLLMNGGTAGIDSPTPYSATADGLLKSLGVDPVALTAKTRASGGGTGLSGRTCAAPTSSTRKPSAPTSWSSAHQAAAEGGVGAVAGPVPMPGTRSRRRRRCRQGARRLAAHPVRRCRGLSAGPVGRGEARAAVENELQGVPARCRESRSGGRENLSAPHRRRVGRRHRRGARARLLGDGLSGLQGAWPRRTGSGPAHELHRRRVRGRRFVSLPLSRTATRRSRACWCDR